MNWPQIVQIVSENNRKCFVCLLILCLLESTQLLLWGIPSQWGKKCLHERCLVVPRISQHFGQKGKFLCACSWNNVAAIYCLNFRPSWKEKTLSNWPASQFLAHALASIVVGAICAEFWTVKHFHIFLRQQMGCYFPLSTSLWGKQLAVFVFWTNSFSCFVNCWCSRTSPFSMWALSQCCSPMLFWFSFIRSAGNGYQLDRFIIWESLFGHLQQINE